MRTRNWSVGVVAIAAVLLTGCTAPTAEPATEETAAASAEPTAAPTSDCPELAEGAVLDGTALSTCVADNMGDAAGYAATMSVLGMDTTARYNPSTESAEMISPMGSLIVIGDDAWVKSASGDWQVADPNSSDPIVAGLSSGAATAAQADPVAMAGTLAGEYKVTGTGTRLGQPVYIVSGTAEQEGVAVDLSFEVTADYVILAYTGSTEVSGQAIETTMEVTEWDVAQDIVAPL